MPATDSQQVLDESVFPRCMANDRSNYASPPREMNEENKLILTPEMIHAEFIEAHMEVTNNSRQE